MHDKLTTPLALALTAVLLACISLIPVRGDGAAARAPTEPSLPVWLYQLPLEDDSQRLAVLIAVKLSARALDAVVAELEPEAAAAPDALAPPRRGKPFRHLTPFYSFASAQPRPQGA
jgi:hypothetical protein